MGSLVVAILITRKTKSRPWIHLRYVQPYVQDGRHRQIQHNDLRRLAEWGPVRHALYDRRWLLRQCPRPQGVRRRLNSVTHKFSNFRSYSFDNDPSIVTHFEGISAASGGFSIAATEASRKDLGASYAFIPVRKNGSFGTSDR